MLSIALLVLPNCMLSGVIGPLEIFSIANGLAKDGTPVFDRLELVGMSGEEVLSFTGIPMAVHGPIAQASPDIIIIPPILAELEKLIRKASLIRWLRERHDSGSIIATCCAGSFLLAETGLLDGKASTTHWQLIEQFREKYPKVDLQPQTMLIDGGHYICAGGAMAWQDLALHIVARFIGGEVASTCAKVLVMDGTRHVQTPYFMFDHRSQHGEGHTDSGIDVVEKWMQQNYHLPVKLPQLAEVANVGVRTFLRRFKRATGQTPLGYLQQLRIEAARHLLEVSAKNIEEITGLTGYADSSSFRRLFKEKTGLTPKEYRNKFQRLV